jgi:OCT family organic cation transporter-like MFS transporter 4/5
MLVCWLKWDLVCDRGYLTQLSQTILIIGVMVGAMVGTSVSDYLGRKPVFFFCQLAMAVVGVANAFVTNLHGYLFLRFLTGALQQVGNSLSIRLNWINSSGSIKQVV